MNAENNGASPEEILGAAILLREDDDNWDARVAWNVMGRVRRRRRRNLAAAAILTFALGGGLGLNSFYRSQQAEVADPYVALYETLYAGSAAYPEFE